MSKVNILILHNIRSAYNVGSILRTADGFGLKTVYMTGITPYPKQVQDSRLPHVIRNTHKRISKTALGAEKNLITIHHASISALVEELKANGLKIIALEQSKNSINIKDITDVKQCALILGNEVSGIDHNILSSVDQIVEIPMIGTKESFNVSIAAAVAIYVINSKA